MKRLAILLCLLAASACSPMPESATPPGPTVYHQAGSGTLVACKPVGFDMFCRGG